MSFTTPIGSAPERATGKIWPGRWIDATPFDTLYSLGYHTGADLNLNYPNWNADAHSKVYAMGAGKVTYARIYSRQYWGAIIIIDHGTVDGKPLVSRYAHVENIKVMVNQNVETGEHIANVGNGENLFPYHLHFDISQTDILLNSPGHWPGHTRQLVRIHYVNPKEWLQAHITSVDGVVNPPPPTTQEWYVVAPIGLRVRKDHSTSALQVDALPFGSRVSIEDSSTVDQDSYTWGKISGGMHDGNWMAMGKADKSETYLSKYP